MKITQVHFVEGVKLDGKAATVPFFSAADGVDITMHAAPPALRIQAKGKKKVEAKDGTKEVPYDYTLVPFANIKSFQVADEGDAQPVKGK